MKRIYILIVLIGMSIVLYGCNEQKTNESKATGIVDEITEEVTISNIPEQLVIKYGEKVDTRFLGIKATDQNGNDISRVLKLEIEDTSDLVMGEHQITLTITDHNNKVSNVEVNVIVEDYESLEEGVNVVFSTIPEYENTTVDDYFKLVYVMKGMIQGVFPTASARETRDKICPLANELNLSVQICWGEEKLEIPSGDRFFHENGLIYLDNTKSYLIGAKQSSSIEIPNTVTTIGDFAYAYHQVYNDLYIPDGVKVIGNYAFYKIVIKGKFNIPDSIEVIGDEPFLLMSYNNTYGEAINVPDNLRSIGKRVFAHLKLEENIVLNQNIEYIGEGAFAFAYYLNTLTVLDGNTNYQTINGVLYNKDLTTIIHYPRSGGSVIDFPKTVKTIGTGAFKAAQLPAEFKIPNTVTIIASNAFYSSSLKGELHLPSELEEIGDYAFFSTNITGELKLPNTLKYIGSSAFMGTSINGQLIIPDSAKIIESNAFANTQIDKLVLGSSLEKIHYGAFSTFSLTGEVIIPDSIKIIEGGVFSLSKITSIVIGENVFRIEENALPRTLQSATFKGLRAPTIEDRNFRYNYSTIIIYRKKDAVGFDDPFWKDFTIRNYWD